jgi:type I restriction enzyme S subunit
MMTSLQEIDVARSRPLRNWPLYPRYKATGIDWLRDVPEHWVVKRLKHLAAIRAGENITALMFDDDGEYPVYGGNGIRGCTSRFTHDGDFVLIGRQGALCGNVHRVHGKFWASEHAAVATCRDAVNPDWLAYLIQTMDLKRYSETAAQPGLSLERVARLAVPFPQPDEQRAIAAFLDCGTAKIDNLIAGCSVDDSAIGVMARMSRVLKEYRFALITAAITGQIDVRNYRGEAPCR